MAERSRGGPRKQQILVTRYRPLEADSGFADCAIAADCARRAARWWAAPPLSPQSVARGNDGRVVQSSTDDAARRLALALDGVQARDGALALGLRARVAVAWAGGEG